MKILTVVGARPQFVKAAVVSHEFRLDREIREIVVNTGQHYDNLLSDIFVRELNMTEPAYNLEVGSATHGVQTARILERTEEIMMRERPDCTLVYGDTNSTLGGALAAAKLHIPVVHVEAGLRSFNRKMPEEVNRILTDHLSGLLLTPSEAATHRLMEEGIPAERIVMVGDVMYDAVRVHLAASERGSTVMKRLRLSPGEYVLCTIHRAENTDNPERLQRLLQALQRVSNELTVVFPVHPRSRKALESCGMSWNGNARMLLTDPVGYLDMIALEKSAAVVATDSGGVQKEAFFLQTPCVTLRDETEWTELIASNWNRLAPPDGTVDIADVILSCVGRQGTRGVQPYGDGHAAPRICAAVRTFGATVSTQQTALVA